MKIHSDRRSVANILSEDGVLAHIDALASSITGIRNTDALLNRLFERVFDAIPAKQGVVLLAGAQPGELEPAAFSGNAFHVDTAIPSECLRDSAGILVTRATTAVLCAPLGKLGAIYLDTPEACTIEHLRLLIAMAAEASVRLDFTLHIDSVAGENQELRAYAHLDHGLVGESPAIAEVRTFIDKVSRNDSTVLILGEMGTGKDLVARAIHRSSRRAEGPFVAVNCAAIQETLIESELFGHERGAFSGAVALKKGKVEVANRGTLFLDEIGELKPQIQAALLRFLQEREFQRVGGTRTLHADVRIVAATNRNLKDSVEKGEFRGDLYYRLGVIPFRTPSLREMREDIPRLAQHFVNERRYLRVVKGISPDALKLLAACDWPGNVRQLQNAIEQALALGASEFIEPEDLPEAVIEGKDVDCDSRGYEAMLNAFKIQIVKDALAEARGNTVEAARALGITASYLRRLRRNLGID